MRVAVVGCSHGELETIYGTIEHIQKTKNIRIDLLLICGDFQAVRNEDDLETMACPPKYRSMRNFYKYYSGEAVAPVTTLYIGGNHESSQLQLELFHGGWVAPKIYAMGFASILNFGGLRIAGLSGIYKGKDYQKGHFETPPLDANSQRSIYHVRSYETMQFTQVNNKNKTDILLTHDWPADIAFHGNRHQLYRYKSFLKDEIERHELGSPPARRVLDHLKPGYHFSAHLHAKFSALVTHDAGTPDERSTRFLALSKVLPGQQYLQVVDFPDIPCGTPENPIKLEYDAEWLAIVRKTYPYLETRASRLGVRVTALFENKEFAATEADIVDIEERFGNDLTVPENFEVTVPPHNPAKPRQGKTTGYMNNAQTAVFLEKLGLVDKFRLKFERQNPHSQHGVGGAGTAQMSVVDPNEIDLDDSDDGASAANGGTANGSASSSKSNETPGRNFSSPNTQSEPRNRMSLPPPRNTSQSSGSGQGTTRQERPPISLPPPSSQGKPRGLIEYISNTLGDRKPEEIGLSATSVDADVFALSEKELDELCGTLPLLARGRVKREWNERRPSSQPKSTPSPAGTPGRRKRKMLSLPPPKFSNLSSSLGPKPNGASAGAHSPSSSSHHSADSDSKSPKRVKT